MANVNAPFGLRLLGTSGGGVPATMGTVERLVGSSAAAIFNGDPVMNHATDGTVIIWANGQVVSRLAGIFRGCKYFNTALQRVVWSNYWPGSGATGDVTAYVEPIMAGAELQFVVQASGAAIGQGDIGCNFDVVIGAGNTTTGISTTALDSAQANTSTATLPFRVVNTWEDFGAPASVGQDSTASYNWVIVAPNVLQATGAHS
jgi:hypothetical protein